MRPGEQVGDPVESAHQLGAFHCVAVRDPREVGQFVVRLETCVAEVDGKRDHHAGLVIGTEEVAERDDAQGLRCAVVRVGAPCDVGQQARRHAAAALLSRFLYAERVQRVLGPIGEFPTVLRVAAVERRQILRGGEKRIVSARLRVEQVVEEALPHAGAGNDHPVRPHSLQHLGHQHRADGQQWTARFRHIATFIHFRDLVGVGFRHVLQEVGHVAQLVALLNVQRVVGVRHVQPREGAPCSAHGIERLATFELVLVQLRGRDLARRFHIAPGLIEQAKPAQRHRDTISRALWFDADEFERTTAKVTNQSICIVHARDHGERGEAGFLFA